MSGGDWKDMYAAAVEGDLALVRCHINAGVNPNYQHPEILCTPLVASLIHGHSDIARYLSRDVRYVLQQGLVYLFPRPQAVPRH